MDLVLGLFKLLKPVSSEEKLKNLEEEFQKSMRLSERNENVLVVKKL